MEDAKKIECLYMKTRDFSEGLAAELNDTSEHNRFKVIQKHVRFQVLNALVQKYADNGLDLKYYILHNHHSEDELSQRDITKRLKMLWSIRRPSERTSLLNEATSETRKILEEITLRYYRKKIEMVLGDKLELLDKALNDDFLDRLEQMMESFDQKLVANFTSVFRLQMRGVKEKGKGKACKKKLSKMRSERNGQMWADPESRQALRDAIQQSWDQRKNGNGNPEEATS